jgi:hypothetical protein
MGIGNCRVPQNFPAVGTFFLESPAASTKAKTPRADHFDLCVRGESQHQPAGAFAITGLAGHPAPN